MSNTSQRKNPMGSLRDKYGKGSEGRSFFTLRRGVRDIVVLTLVLNVLNVILYNTGWINWRQDAFDIIWATVICCLDVLLIYILQVLDHE